MKEPAGTDTDTDTDTERERERERWAYIRLAKHLCLGGVHLSACPLSALSEKKERERERDGHTYGRSDIFVLGGYICPLAHPSTPLLHSSFSFNSIAILVVMTEKKKKKKAEEGRKNGYITWSR